MKHYSITFLDVRGRCVATAAFRADEVQAADRLRAFEGIPLSRRIVVDGDLIPSLGEPGGRLSAELGCNRDTCVPSMAS
jgi:hypothetical protein